MLPVKKSQLSNELTFLIINKSNGGQLTEANLMELVSNFFNEKQINSNEDKSNIIRRCLVKLHPDRNILNVSDQAIINKTIITKTLNSIRDNQEILLSAERQPDVQEFNESAFFRCLFSDSVFKNNGMEQYVAGLAAKHEVIDAWFSSKSATIPLVFNAPLQFVKYVQRREVLILDSRQLMIMLIKIAVMELIIQHAQVDQPMHRIIETYSDPNMDYPKECSKDPMGWLINQILLDNTEIAQEQEANSSSLVHQELPSLVEIFSTLQVFEQYEDIVSLRALISKWSSDKYLPQVKALLSQIIIEAESSESKRRKVFYNGRIEISNGEPVFRISEHRNDDLLTLFKLENTLSGPETGVPNDSSYLRKLEDDRSKLIITALYIPVVLFSAKYQLMNPSGERPVSNETIGEFLTSKLSQLNSLINQERERHDFVPEDTDFQPVLEIPGKSYVNLVTPTGLMIPYFQPVSGRNLENSPVLGKLNFTAASGGEWIPKYIHPKVIDIIKDTMIIAKIKVNWSGYYIRENQINKTEYGIQKIFDLCLQEHSAIEASKKFLFQFSEKFFKKLDPRLDTEFTLCLNNLCERLQEERNKLLVANNKNSIFHKSDDKDPDEDSEDNQATYGVVTCRMF